MFKVGDKVRSIKFPEFGLGIVIRSTARTSKERPIEVAWEQDQFDPTESTTYTVDGEQQGELRIRKVTPLEQLL